MNTYQRVLRPVLVPGMAILVVLAVAALPAGCAAIPGLARATSTPIPTNTPTATYTPTHTSTPAPTSTFTQTPTQTPSPTPVALSLSIELQASTVQPGQLLALSIEPSRPATMAASLRDRPLSLFEENGKWYGLIGIAAPAQPATWPIVITAKDPLGGPAITERRDIRIGPREFPLDEVILTEETLSLILDPVETQKEADLVAGLLKPQTPKRLWEEPFIRPVDGEVTTTYGERRSYNGGPANEYHGGLDLATDGGVPIAAANNGRVVFAGPLKVRGNAVIIDHGWGLYSGYYHMSALEVVTGETVKRGQTIGLVGSTGLSTGPHVHWTIWLNGDAIDPVLVMEWQLPG